MVRRRRSVLLLLLALTVLSPLVLYTRRLSVALNPIQRRDLPGVIANQGRGVKASKLNALPLETVGSLKEPVGVVFSEEPRELTDESIESENQELPLRKEGEHKNRVLSEVTAAADAGSKEEGLIAWWDKMAAWQGTHWISRTKPPDRSSNLLLSTNEKVKALEQTLIKGKQIQDDCSIVVKKLRAMLHSAEEQLHAHKKQTVFLTQLAAKTLPKGLHCLPLRLANEYFSLDPGQRIKSQSFNVLASYLFAKNTTAEQMEMTTPVFTRKGEPSGEKMDMTTPVITKKSADENKWTMSFVMPSKYGSNLPLPKDTSVTIKEVTSKIIAVAAFSGLVTDDDISRREASLREALQKDTQFRVKDDAVLEVAQYNPPFTLPFTRRNEIALEVEQHDSLVMS